MAKIGSTQVPSACGSQKSVLPMLSRQHAAQVKHCVTQFSAALFQKWQAICRRNLEGKDGHLASWLEFLAYT